MLRRGNTSKAVVLHVLEFREHVNILFSLCSVFVDYPDFSAPAVPMVFHVFVLHVGMFFRLSSPVDWGFVINGFVAITGVWRWCFCRWRSGFTFQQDPYRGRVRKVLPAAVDNWWRGLSLCNHQVF